MCGGGGVHVIQIPARRRLTILGRYPLLGQGSPNMGGGMRGGSLVSSYMSGGAQPMVWYEVPTPTPWYQIFARGSHHFLWHAVEWGSQEVGLAAEIWPRVPSYSEECGGTPLHFFPGTPPSGEGEGVPLF